MVDDTQGAFVYLLGWSLSQIGIVLRTINISGEFYCVVSWLNRDDPPNTAMDITIVKISELIPAEFALEAAAQGIAYTETEQYVKNVRDVRTMFRDASTRTSALN